MPVVSCYSVIRASESWCVWRRYPMAGAKFSTGVT